MPARYPESLGFQAGHDIDVIGSHTAICVIKQRETERCCAPDRKRGSALTSLSYCVLCVRLHAGSQWHRYFILWIAPQNNRMRNTEDGEETSLKIPNKSVSEHNSKGLCQPKPQAANQNSLVVTDF